MKSKEYATELVNYRFFKCERKKVGKKFYYEDLEASHLAGTLSALEELYNEHKKSPYKDVDEVVGQMQMLMTKYWNYYRLRYDFKKKPVQLEDFLSELWKAGRALGEILYVYKASIWIVV